MAEHADDYARLTRESADRALAHAAHVASCLLSLKFPPPSREAAIRSFERELRERFDRAVADVNKRWAP